MKEYKIAKGWAIFIWIFAPGLIVLFTWLFIEPFLSGKPLTWEEYWMKGIMCLGMTGLMIVGLIDLRKLRVVIAADRIFTKGVMPGRQLMFEEIRGYRQDDNYTYVEPLQKGKKRIRISKYMGRYDEIVSWLQQRYPDLDQVEVEQEEEEILNNDFLGIDTDERERKLVKARKISKVMNWSGGLLAAWGFFWPEPYKFVMLAAIVFPLLAIMVMLFYKGLIRFDERKNSAYPNMLAALMFPSMIIAARVLLDYNLFSYGRAWNLAVLLAIALAVLILFASGEFRPGKPRTYFLAFCIMLVMCAYSYGAVIALNCIFDRAEPAMHEAVIFKKRIESGKVTTYRLELSPWGPRKEEESITVTKNLYKLAEPGNKIAVYLHQGLFGIPWISVDDE
jgi:uncharacterized membrane protein